MLRVRHVVALVLLKEEGDGRFRKTDVESAPGEGEQRTLGARRQPLLKANRTGYCVLVRTVVA